MKIRFFVAVLFLCIMQVGCSKKANDQEEELTFWVTDNRDSREIVYYQCASDFIADCGFEEDKPFWEYDTEEGSLQLVLYYDEVSGEGCGIRYYPEEENKQEEGFRFHAGSEEPQYSVMEAWTDLASSSRLSCKRSTGKTAVSSYEEFADRFLNSHYDYDMEHFVSKGVVESAEDAQPSSLIEIDWTYRDDETLQKKEYRHNARVFGTYRSSANYYYGKDERLLYQKYDITQGSGDVYYIYREDEILPEFYLHIDHVREMLDAELISYDSEIPDEDRLNLDEEMILAQYDDIDCNVEIDHYDEEGNPVVHVYEVMVNEDESHTNTYDWITVNPDTGIGINFGGEIVDIIQQDEKILYYQFLNGKIEAEGTGGKGREILSSYYEYGPLNHTFIDLNHDDTQELIIYPAGIFMQILTIDQGEVHWVSAPFYSGATGEIINENREIVMVDESHAGRSQYSVYRLNDEKELEDVIFFQVWFAGENTGLEKNEYTQYIGGFEKGTEESITEEEFNALYEKYVQNALEIEWMKHMP